jgi:predicted O-methyltransferase YrrM/DNA-binding PadR family transcriptional regulator
LYSGRKLSSSDLQLILLALLANQPAHGYELIKALEDHSHGLYVPSPGMIYPALTYLEEVGFASTEMEGNKKRYRLTKAGRNHFEQNRDAAARILSDMERIGAQMAQARQAMESGLVPEESGDGTTSEALEAARRELRSAQHEKEPYTTEEVQRIAEILQRASADIRRGPQPKAPAGVGPILDPAVTAVIARMTATKHHPPSPPQRNAEGRVTMDPFVEKERGFSIKPEQGNLIYLLCRAIGAKRVAEFATSFGLSTLYLAAAVRDNGGGLVIGSEIVPEKVETARRNLAEAGLADFVDVREGDARETLRDLGGPIDFLLIDGWPSGEGVSLALQVMEMVAPQVRVGGIVMNDNGEADYLAYIRDPANAFLSMSLPLKGSTELSLKVREI